LAVLLTCRAARLMLVLYGSGITSAFRILAESLVSSERLSRKTIECLSRAKVRQPNRNKDV